MKKLIIILILFSIVSCATKTSKYLTSNDTNNSKQTEDKPYVLLISIDGYRWDYTEKYSPKFLTNFMKTGSSVKSLRPSYPTKTFPNHLSIITGRYPMNHGIIGNRFYAPSIDRSYSLRDRSAIEDTRFYTAKPLWVLAEEQGMKTATYFWPGSEAKIDGSFPSYYLKYNHGTPHDERINTVLKWFKMPKEKRPHFATLYFHDVDSAGHNYGPNASETEAAVHKVDKSIERLVHELNKLNLPLNIVIVSDHGMAELDEKNVELIGKSKKVKTNLESFKIVGKGPLVHFYRSNSSFKYVTRTMNLINKNAKHFKCYKKNKTPKYLNFRKNKRIGDFVCIADRGWSISHEPKSIPKGNHGWSQFEGTDMHSILYAKGPNFKSAFKQGTVNNIDIYPMLAKILDLKIEHEIDGKIKNTMPLIKE
ncbi:hypothetical protein A9Q84_07560 [Halobacteriovorax marinus]|uniref:Alkaline phosphatase family protein n=1 Tax=Halobacteriovorax marinus TaxID=97084 RepID=A0A1Y5F5P0_9BACT|nr:hypothetical protein A9Q84_07560 [Halobacteriovorax marinus]